ncbi:hypothetical protein HWV62_44003 [Athelia sp. TMB]|nr:hypothetical protein HWV62_44003 [Athelia sp. TMB]
MFALPVPHPFTKSLPDLFKHERKICELKVICQLENEFRESIKQARIANLNATKTLTPSSIYYAAAAKTRKDIDFCYRSYHHNFPRDTEAPPELKEWGLTAEEVNEKIALLEEHTFALDEDAEDAATLRASERQRDVEEKMLEYAALEEDNDRERPFTEATLRHKYNTWAKQSVILNDCKCLQRQVEVDLAMVRCSREMRLQQPAKHHELLMAAC